MFFLGLDIGSSSIKASLVEAATGRTVARSQAPADQEMPIISGKRGFAEQHPDTWWQHVKTCIADIKSQYPQGINGLEAIGISYQMHGLVIIDRDGKPLRNSIIWCDGRAIQQGNQAAGRLSQEYINRCLLNHPGNFTASKLRWVQENEPAIYGQIYKAMLPGDYIGYKMTGDLLTTASGLSEGVMWDASAQAVATDLLAAMDIDPALLPSPHNSFGNHGRVSNQAAQELGIPAGVRLSYRAGDQPNNAFSLNVMDPGEAAANGGTSGVLYVVTDKAAADPEGRVNTFVHVNHTQETPRYGVLACINGTGILYNWLRRMLSFGGQPAGYDQLNKLAAQAPAGSRGLLVLPYGNGAERTLGNADIGASFSNLNFNTHNVDELVRATQEGIAYALVYGLERIGNMGISTTTIRAGRANMFLSSVFAQTFATVANAPVSLYDTDGARGAAMAAGVGAGKLSVEEARATLLPLQTVEPVPAMQAPLADAYNRFKEEMQARLAQTEQEAAVA